MGPLGARIGRGLEPRKQRGVLASAQRAVSESNKYNNTKQESPKEYTSTKVSTKHPHTVVTRCSQKRDHMGRGSSRAAGAAGAVRAGGVPRLAGKSVDGGVGVFLATKIREDK